MVTGPAPAPTGPSASGGWRIEHEAAEPLPPEVFELFPDAALALLDHYVLTAPESASPGFVTIALPPPDVAADLALVVLRPGGAPAIARPEPPEPEVGGVGSTLRVRVWLGAHDGGTRLALLAVRPLALAAAEPPPVEAAPPPPPVEAAPPPLAAPPLPPPDAPPPRHVPAWLAAGMPAHLRPGERASVTVRISRTELGPSGDEAHARKSLLGNPDLALRIKLRRRNLAVVRGTPDRLEVPFPGEHEVVARTFEVEAGTVGPAEAEVVLEQGASVMPLAVVRLAVAVVASAPTEPSQAEAAAPTAAPDPRLAGLPVLRVDEDQFGDRWSLEFDLTLGDDLVRHYEMAPAVPKDAFLDALYERIGAEWGDGNPPRGESGGFEDRLARLGTELAEALMPEGLRADLDAAWDRLEGLAVLSSEGRIPWELAQVAPAGEPARHLGETGLGRWVYGVVHPQRLRVRAGRSRYLCPAYTGELALTQTPLEAEFLAGLGATALEPGDAVSLSALLAERGFDLLHFGGHGASDAEGQRILLAAAGAYPAASVAADFPPRAPDPSGEPGPVVVLNACRLAEAPRTGAEAFAPAFLAGGAGAFIGCLWSVGDRPALAFAEAFYSALRGGETVASAVRAARLAARAAGDPSWLAYTAYAHPLATVEFAP